MARSLAAQWRKLHLAVDAGSSRIVAQILTDQGGDDPSQVGPLLARIAGRIVRVTADGAYDRDPTYQTITAHSDGNEVVIPPRSTAVPGGELNPPSQRDRHLAMITQQGRLAWQGATDYGQRSLVETTMGPSWSYAPSPMNEATGSMTWSSKGLTCEASSTALVVNVAAT